MKAKSRLRPSFTPTSPSKPTKVAYRPSWERPKQHSTSPHWLEKYARHIPTLILAVFGYLGVFYIMSTVSPAAIRDIGFPGSYLPFHAVLLVANFFLFSFLLLNSRRGYVVAFFISVLVFLKLQGFTLTSQLLTMLLVLFVIIEISGSILERVLGSHASVHAKSVTDRRR